MEPYVRDAFITFLLNTLLSEEQKRLYRDNATFRYYVDNLFPSQVELLLIGMERHAMLQDEENRRKLEELISQGTISADELEGDLRKLLGLEAK